MGSDIQTIAKQVVYEYAQAHLDKSDKKSIYLDDIYVVWFCYILKNWKVLISTTLNDGMYYEVTYNFDKDEIYLDAYKKFENKLIRY